MARQPPGLGVYARAQRGHAALYAHDPAGDFDYQGGGAVAGSGPDHQEFPGSRLRLRQGRRC